MRRAGSDTIEGVGAPDGGGRSLTNQDPRPNSWNVPHRLEHEYLTLYPKKVEVVHALEPYVDAQVGDDDL